MTVMIAERSSTRVSPYVLRARAGDTFRISMLISPAMISSVPAAGSQLNLNWVGTGSPAALRMSSPGQSNR